MVISQLSSKPLETEWKKCWKLGRKTRAEAAQAQSGKKRKREKGSPALTLSSSGLSQEIAATLRRFVGPRPTLQDLRYRVALICRDYLQGFYELALVSQEEVAAASASNKGHCQTEEGIPIRRNRRVLKPDWLQDAFEELVGRYDREQELGRRQRANYAAVFNELAEKLQPCFPELPFEPVRNYSRSPRHLPVTAATNLEVPPSYYDRLMVVLERDTLYPEELPAEKEADPLSREQAHLERFARFAVLVMLRLGVTFRGVIGALSRLEFQDVRLEQGLVVVYHNSSRRTWLPVWLDDLTALALYSLISHRARSSEDIRKRLVLPQAPRTLLATWQVLEEKEKAAKSSPTRSAARFSSFSQEEEEEVLDDEENEGGGDEEEEDEADNEGPGDGGPALRIARKAIEDYFKRLCEQAGLELPVTLVQLLHATRWVLNERSAFGEAKTGAVIAMLSGFIKPGFFSEEMAEPDWKAQPPFWLTHLLAATEHSAIRSKRPPLYKKALPSEIANGAPPATPELKSNPDLPDNNSSPSSSSLVFEPPLSLEEAARLLREAMRQLDDHAYTSSLSGGASSTLTRKQEDKRQRRETSRALRQLTIRWLNLESNQAPQQEPAPEGIPEQAELVSALKRAYGAGELNNYQLNLATVASWLAWLSGEHQPPLRAETLATYRTEALYLLTTLPDTLLTEYEWEEAEEVLELDLAENPPTRRKAVLKSLRGYLAGVVGLPVSELDLENSQFSFQSRTSREQILTPSQIWKLLEGLDPLRANKDRNVLLAVLLGYFGMLRAGEICRLRCGDLVLGCSRPYLRVENSKRHKSRVMPLGDLPPVLVALLEQLRRERKARLEQSRGPLRWEVVAQEPLLVSESGQPLSPSRLSALIKERLRECGYGETTLHDFRKGGANWRYYSTLNLSAVEIGKQLGHAGLMVTFKCYLKGLDLVQREMAQKLTLLPQTVGNSPATANDANDANEEEENNGTGEWTLPAAKLALMADLSRQQIYNLLGKGNPGLTLALARHILEQKIAPAFSRAAEV